MDAATLLRAVEDALTAPVQALGGVVAVASDPDHVVELLGTSPANFRVIFSDGGDEAVDADNSPGIVRQTLNTTVQAAQGLTLKPGSMAYKETVAGRLPLLALSSEISRLIRGLHMVHEDIHKHGFRHQSSQWLVIEDIPTRQRLMNHRVIMALDKPITTEASFS